MVDPGETAPAALVRELREETGVDLAGHQPVILGRNLVDDWRTTRVAWSPGRRCRTSGRPEREGGTPGFNRPGRSRSWRAPRIPRTRVHPGSPSPVPG
ncbi:NUDIX domain-containing protein [Streptomyces sp. NPDC085540]|uniref:NUDIX domain-containing protein n=1 Tax=Streptomyces sp. NPDC085540 TaxID=3365730 RepID=UPI0037D4C73E